MNNIPNTNSWCLSMLVKKQNPFFYAHIDYAFKNRIVRSTDLHKDQAKYSKDPKELTRIA